MRLQPRRIEKIDTRKVLVDRTDRKDSENGTDKTSEEGYDNSELNCIVYILIRNTALAINY